MLDWRRGVKRLRKRLAGRPPAAPRPQALGSGEIAGSQSHLSSLLACRPPFKTPGEGQVVVSEEGAVALAVEGGMAVAGGGVAVRGWLSDPHGEVAGLWLEIDGTFRRASLAGRMYREDVLTQRALMEAFPGHHAGLYLFEPFEVDPGRPLTVNLHAVVRTQQGYVVRSSGTALNPNYRCSLDRIVNEFNCGLADPATIAAAAAPLLKGLAADRRIAWRERRVETATGEPADLAVVIVVEDNLDMLHHVLAALEMCRHARRMEIVLSLQSPGAEAAVSQCVRAWRGSSPFAGIKMLVPILPIGFGLAANAGIEFAQSPVIALASDEILPPNGKWVGAALDLLSQEPRSLLIPAIATFDHRPFTFGGVFDLAWAQFEHDHSGLSDLARLEPFRRSLRWSCGFLVARREVMEAARGLDDSQVDMDICLLEFVSRLELDGAARLESLPGAFTHLRLRAPGAGHPAQRLWSLYALSATVRRRQGEVTGSLDAAAEGTDEQVQQALVGHALDPDGHLAPALGRAAVGEYEVPDGKNGGVIGVGVAAHRVVMHPMDRRGDDDP